MDTQITFASWLEGSGKTLHEVASLISELEVERGSAPITYQYIQHWRDNQVPSKRLWSVQKVTGLTFEQLRPDIFGVSA